MAPLGVLSRLYGILPSPAELGRPHDRLGKAPDRGVFDGDFAGHPRIERGDGILGTLNGSVRAPVVVTES